MQSLLSRNDLSGVYDSMMADAPWNHEPFPEDYKRGAGLQRQQLDEVRRQRAADAAAAIVKTEDQEMDEAAKRDDAKRDARPRGVTYYEFMDMIEKDMAKYTERDAALRGATYHDVMEATENDVAKSIKDLAESVKALHGKVDELQADLKECTRKVKVGTEGVQDELVFLAEHMDRIRAMLVGIGRRDWRGILLLA